MDTFGFFIHSSDSDSDEQMTPSYIQRKRLRMTSNPLDMPNKRFIKLFRVTKDLFSAILTEIEPHFKPTKNKDAITPILKLANTLRFLAEGSYQQAVGQNYLIGMAQFTVSVVLSETLYILESTMCDKYINFHLSVDEKRKSKEYFFNKTGFQGVIGCVDGTHINLIRPAKNEHHFYNRMGAHSLNVMMTYNYNTGITSVDCRFGGCFHDSVIWNASSNRIVMEQNWRAGDKTSWLLGDSGYTLEPWMMTPYRKTAEGSGEALFNTVHAKARSIVERVFGILKGRWRCLLHSRELHYMPEKSTQIVNVCCLLHNLCVKYNVPIDENEIEPEDNMYTNAKQEVISENLAEEAKRIRDSMKNSLTISNL